MEKNAPSKKLSVIGLILVVLVALFVGVLGLGWRSSVKLREMVAANASAMNIDSSAQIERERLRNLAESIVTNSRAYFLLGSKSVFDHQEEEKQRFAEGVTKFVKENPSPEIEDIAKTIESISKQEADFFEQGMAFRAKATESKIVAQFYHSKTNPLLAQLNEQFEKIGKIQTAAIDQAKTHASQAGADAQAQIPKDMLWFMTAVSAIFLCTTVLVIWLLVSRRGEARVRDRLYADAQKSALARDEVISAVAHDMKAPLADLQEVAKELPPESAEILNNIASEIDFIVSDILDQKSADMGSLTLRMEQLPIAGVLEDAQAMLQPIAKRRDVSLQFDAVNLSVLAYIDRERVMRVLSNLIGNAIKFSPRHARIQVKVKGDAQFANISIIDAGPGIPEARLATVFENFWQAKGTADQGPGLGLAIVKTIVEAHGGSVRAEKNPLGGGTVFTFSLPRRLPVGVALKKRTATKRVARPSIYGEPPTV